MQKQPSIVLSQKKAVSFAYFNFSLCLAFSSTLLISNLSQSNGFVPITYLHHHHHQPSFALDHGLNTNTRHQHHEVPIICSLEQPDVRHQRLTAHGRKKTYLAMAFLHPDHSYNNDNDGDDDDNDDDEDIFASSSFLSTNDIDIDIDIEGTRQTLEALVTQSMGTRAEKETDADGTTITAASEITGTGTDLSEDQNFSRMGPRKNNISIASTLRSKSPVLHLTDNMREQRFEEIQLMSSLVHSDDAVSQLEDMWISERGISAKAALMHAHDLISMQSYREAQQILLPLIDKYGIHFVEPVHCMATLYYMQGRYHDAMELLEIVLDVKPWHFDALSTMVMISTVTNNISGARIWAKRRIPQLNSKNQNKALSENNVDIINDHFHHDERFDWTKEAVEKAREKLYNDSRVGRSVYAEEESLMVRNFRAELQQHLAADAIDSVDGHVDQDTHTDLTVDAWQ